MRNPPAPLPGRQRRSAGAPSRARRIELGVFSKPETRFDGNYLPCEVLTGGQRELYKIRNHCFCADDCLRSSCSTILEAVVSNRLLHAI